MQFNSTFSEFFLKLIKDYKHFKIKVTFWNNLESNGFLHNLNVTVFKFYENIW